MRSKSLLLLLCLLCIPAGAQQYVPALPGYHYEFPRDHFDHPDYQTEWWYYTGNLRAKDGHRFGFELTFFRQGMTREPNASPWAIHDLYMAHLALSDVTGKHYYSLERLNRGGPGIAGVNAATSTVWNGNWHAVINEKAHTLRGLAENFSLDLTASPQKPPVIHGENGISQKSEGIGHASHYISFTRMNTRGTLRLNGDEFQVDGDTWMDHEFFTEPGTTTDVGWDWLSLQLANNTELMLYRLRHKDGTVDPYSSATFIDAQGHATHLTAGDLTMTPNGTTWKSSGTGGVYPIGWSVDVPKLKLQLTISTPLPAQEFVSHVGPSYWEGAIDVEGRAADQPIRGSGYLEMTGYSNGRSPTIPSSPR